jgi:preprotein translocase subunit SecG
MYHEYLAWTQAFSIIFLQSRITLVYLFTTKNQIYFLELSIEYLKLTNLNCYEKSMNSSFILHRLTGFLGIIFFILSILLIDVKTKIL